MARVRSVNVGRPMTVEWAALGATAIDKTPAAGPVEVTRLGLVGDTQVDTRHHGGEEQAVYAFAREDLDVWGGRLGADLADGRFGENLTTEGIDINAALVGERWRVGSALLCVTSVRTPCNDFKGWVGASGLDNTAWVKRFTAEGRPGPYLRVLEEGSLQAGDEIEVVHRPDHGLTVSRLFAALTTDRSLLPELLGADGLGVEGLGDKPRRKAQQYAGR